MVDFAMPRAEGVLDGYCDAPLCIADWRESWFWVGPAMLRVWKALRRNFRRRAVLLRTRVHFGGILFVTPRFEGGSMGVGAPRQIANRARALRLIVAMLGFVNLFRRLAMPRRCADDGDIYT